MPAFGSDLPSSRSGLSSDGGGLSLGLSRSPLSRRGASLCLSGTSPCRSGTPTSRSRSSGAVSGAPHTSPCGRVSALGPAEPIDAERGAKGSARKSKRLGVDAHSAAAEASALGAPLRSSDTPDQESDRPHGMPGVPHQTACAQASEHGVSICVLCQAVRRLVARNTKSFGRSQISRPA